MLSTELLGLLMFASWIYSLVIIFRRLKDTTREEKWVLWIGLVTLGLFIVGSISR